MITLLLLSNNSAPTRRPAGGVRFYWQPAYLRWLRTAALVVLVGLVPFLAIGQAYPTGQKLFPAAAVINVKKVYGAKGDGQTDDTQALQRAISENVGRDRTLYFPNGTYLISRRLDWKSTAGKWESSLTLQGQSQQNTIIRLQNNAPDFAQAGSPRGMLRTGSHAPDYREDGYGMDAFNNHLFDLTLDAGSGNPGAYGVDYVGTNSAAIRNVTVRSTDGQGVAGLAFVRQGVGPCMVKNVTVEGFNYGVLVKAGEPNIVFEHLTFRHQKLAGLRNEGDVLSIRKLYSENTVPAVLNALSGGQWPGNYGMCVVTDAQLVGLSGAGSTSAIVNEDGPENKRGGLYVRNVTTTGYQSAIRNRGTVVPGATTAEFVTEAFGTSAAQAEQFRQPVEETPEFHQNDTTKWANVRDFGAIDDNYGDDTEAVQNALNSGKEVIYFPKGYRYNIKRTLTVGPQVKQLLGMMSDIDIEINQTFGDASNPQPVFRFAGGTQPVVFMERFNLTNGRRQAFAGGIYIEHASAQTLVLRDLDNFSDGKYYFQNAPGAGKLFIDNVASLIAWNFRAPQQVWARQLDPESHHVPEGTPLVRRQGGDLWVLGLKMEGARTVLEVNGGRAEVLGGILYPVAAVPASLPAFVGNNASLKLSFGQASYNTTNRFLVLVKDQQPSGTTYLNHTDVAGSTPGKLFRGDGTLCPLYLGAAPTGIPNGTYTLVAKHSGKVLDVDGAAIGNGVNVWQYTRNNSTAQRWRVQALGDGYYTLTAECSGKVLDVSGISQANGANVHQWEYVGGLNQQWKIEAVGGGYYKLTARHSGKALDVAGGSSATGDRVNVHQWEYVGGDNQQWRLEPAVGAATITAARQPAAAAAPADLTAYPNPARDFLHVALPAAASGATATLTDLLGRTVRSTPLPAAGSARLDVRGLAPGAYLLQVQQPGQPARTRRVVVGAVE